MEPPPKFPYSHFMDAIDWTAAEHALRATGFARLGKLLTPDQAHGLTAIYASETRFRSRIDMQRYRFGRGEYQYFAYPLPDLVAALRNELYRGLAPAANRWMADLRIEASYPPELGEFTEACHAAGQTRPTPLLLRYREGDYNCLHQDLYGAIHFPLQAIVLLDRPGVDFEGGELVLVEQRPRRQSRPMVVPLRQGCVAIVAVKERPVASTRGVSRVQMRHGVSTVRTGLRRTLGLIFHDAA